MGALTFSACGWEYVLIMFLYLDSFVCLYWDMVSVRNSGYPETHYAEQVGFDSQSSSFLSLQSAGIKGRQCHAWLWVWFLRLNILPSSSHHVAANDRFFFSILYIWVAILCVSMSQFPYPLIYQWMLSSLHSLATADDLAWAWECSWHPGPLSDTDSERRLAALVTTADCCGLHGRCDTAHSSNPQTHNGSSFLCPC